jgi:2,5-furandicarboxylate decarboxylase 1
VQEDLRMFLSRLEEADLLQRITREVDARFELSAVAKGVERLGKAMVFENVKGYDVPVATNVFGSRTQLAMIFNTTPEDVVREFMRRSEERVEPVLVEGGPCKEVIKLGDEADVDALPLVTHCEKDAGPYVTAGIIITKDPETGGRNVSINRMMYKNAHSLACRMMPPQHLGIIQAKAEARDEPLEIAVAVGNHPIENLVASTTLAYGDDEFTLAGALRRAPLELVKCETVDLEVPATSEIVLEGEIVPNLREDEGPFGDLMQYYVPVMQNHVFRLKAITHRREPMWQTIQASSLEDVHLLALSREAKVMRAVEQSGAKIKAVSLVPTIMSAVVSIEKQFEGEPKNVAAAAFGAYSWLKYCVVVDHDVDVFDINDVWWAMATRSDVGKGLLQMQGALGFPRDLFQIHQSKLGIDATAPLDQWQEFERKRIPGFETMNLQDYLG